MKFLFYFGHPAQYLAMRETIRSLLAKNENQVTVLIRSKDVLETLIQKDGIPHRNILPVERGHSRLAMLISLLKRMAIMLPVLIRSKPDLLIGTDAAIAQLGRLLRINRITIVEDDYGVIKKLADLTYPFTQTILCPEICEVGNWGAKKFGYRGYMKLGYLHPTVFSPDASVLATYSLTKKYVLIRLSRLAAHHDIGMRGIDQRLLDEIIHEIMNRYGYQVWISAEGKLAEMYKAYQLPIHPSDMHHVLAYATLLISDSQSMSVEAAMLGIPSIRYSGFTSKISILSELEHRYGLTFGITTGQPDLLLSKLYDLLTTNNLGEVFQEKRQKMLADQIDVSAFLTSFFQNYPASKQGKYEASSTPE
ncbi:hypothetical protein M0L20_23750 [Spirosoma sp. RP8]|uniref:DUF354 domain-containing protein n=1 Tax=Spirosoma liriopis TaxID=2937440 RepID=A0ABT0HSE1_9BACT|nr:hypothetical protein [Spirosoma liriopis]MCK8494905.1 hypothetical protein [Spirosoma liriopis]